MVGLEASAFTLIAQYEVYAWSQATEGTLTPSEPALTGAVGSQPKPGGAQNAKPAASLTAPKAVPVMPKDGNIDARGLPKKLQPKLLPRTNSAQT